jgi:lipoprotein-releasing system permease protein
VTLEEMNANLFGALKLQKVVLTVFFLIIIAVAAFNVVGSQIMLIHDKRSSIAILKAMGASEGGIMKVFLIQGGAVSAAGTLVGLALGLGICLLIDVVGYPLDAEVYLISQLPVEVTPGLVAVVGVMAVVLTTITTLYSSGRASRMEPVDGLRHLD